MAQILWLQGSTLLRQDTLPREWCPWHVHFICPLCGETWLHRLHVEPAVHTSRSRKCTECQTDLEYYGLPQEILNAYERRNNYEPIEILALEFLISSTESEQWLNKLRQAS